MSNVSLFIGSKIYEYWQSVRIVRSLDAVSGSFEVGLTNDWSTAIAGGTFKPGQDVKLAIDDEVILTGFIDDVAVQYSTSEHAFTLRGRDATGQLVDCAADRGKTQFKDKTLTQICTSLCQPFGVGVIAKTDVGQPFKQIDVQQGEKVFEIIERLCAGRAVAATSDGNGNLVLARTGTTKSGRLELGKNILTGNHERSWREQFSEYLVKGQARSGLNLAPATHTQPKAQATDPSLKGFFRPFTLLAETQGDDAKFAERAKFEAARRAGAASKATYTVQGWRNGGNTGALWQPNTLVDVVDKFAGINREMLITSVTFNKDDSGTITTLGVTRPEAFDRLALPEDTGGGLFG